MRKLASLEKHLLCWTKCLFILCNVLLFAIGVTVISLIAMADLDIVNGMSLISHYEPLKVTIACGFSIILVIAAILGACAAIRFSFNQLTISGLLFLTLLIGAIGVTAWAYIDTDYSEDGSLYRQLKIQLNQYSRHKQSVDLLQSTLHCCGVHNFTDWNKNLSKALPNSCCKHNIECSTDSTSLQPLGCYEILRFVLANVGWAVVGALAFLSMIEIFAMLLILPLCSALRRIEKRRWETREMAVKIPRVVNLPSIHEEEHSSAVEHPTVSQEVDSPVVDQPTVSQDCEKPEEVTVTEDQGAEQAKQDVEAKPKNIVG